MPHIERSESIAKVASALKLIQNDLKPIKKTRDGVYSKYAPFDLVVEAAQPVLAKQGCSVTQLIGRDGNETTLTTLLIHESGEYIGSTMRPEVTKRDSQGQGSAITYAKRYMYMSTIGMVAEDDDDDGESGRLASRTDLSGVSSKLRAKGMDNQLKWQEFVQSVLGKHYTQILVEDVPALAEAAEEYKPGNL